MQQEGGEARIKVVDQGLMALGTRTTIALFVYYILVMFCASAAAAYVHFVLSENAGFPPLIYSVLLSLVGSTVFYSRKLYKACITETYNFSSGSSIAVLGTFCFFMLRPIFAAAFAWITYTIWAASIISSVENFSSFSPTHFYLSGILGFFVGFLAGRVLARMEAAGEKHLNGVW